MLRRSVPVLSLLVLWGCGGPAAEERPPHVLLVSLDALRADHLGCHGYGRATSPFLDELAGRGTLFEKAFANTHGTTPSHTTLLTGLYQETHRVGFSGRRGAATSAIPPEVRTLPEILRDHGYVTLGVTGGGNAAARFGFDRGFDAFDDRGGGARRVARRLVRLAEARAGEGRPLFLFLHTYEVHSPYDPPGRYRELFGRFESSFRPTSENLLAHANSARETLSQEDLEKIRALYDAEIRFTDRVLRDLFSGLDDLGLLAAALIVVTADHGEELGEHGGLLHRDLLYEELIRIPLIAVGPGIPAARRLRVPVSSVDIAPSILRSVGLEVPERMEGRSLFGATAAGAGRPIFCQYGDRRYAVRTERWKLIATTIPPGVELYDLRDDPGETLDLAADRPGVTRSLMAALEAWKAERVPAGSGPGVELGAAERSRLRALGYLGGDGAVKDR